MFVTHLSLADFRSYPVADVPLDAGVTVFTGPNGQGKTNLVEAVEYLATLGSHRVATELPLVRHGAERAIVRARVQAGPDDPRQLLLEVEIIPGRANKASLNRSPLRRPRELLGALRAVVFSPEDLALVKGDPSERRRFLDELMTSRWPRMAGVRADYDRVLKQRSTLLKSLSGRGSRPVPPDAGATLEVWNDSLARLGAEVVEARLATLADLAPVLAEAYADIAPTRNEASAGYQASWLPDAAHRSREELQELLVEGMRRRRDEEIARGLSLVGPHRDDLTLALSGLPARGYASHGESWSFALALRLGSLAVLRADGVEPVLVLDDVFAELDETRRDRLAQLTLSAQQVLITAAVPADVPAMVAGRRYKVAAGENPVPLDGPAPEAEPAVDPEDEVGEDSPATGSPGEDGTP